MSSYSHVCIRFVFIIFFLTATYYELIIADNDKLINSNSRHHIANSNERFATPVWINDNVLTSKEIKKFRNLIRMEKKQFPHGTSNSNIGGWQSSPSLYHKLIEHRIGIMELFRDVILRNTIEFVMQYEQTLPLNVESRNIPFIEIWIDGGWANENGFQDFNMPHTHPESFIAGTFYLSKRNQGNLVFEDPRDGVIGTERSFSIKPLKNRLVLFPSWIKHGVEPNPNPKYKRVSFSFNIQLNYLPDKMQSYQRESMFCSRNFQLLELDCTLPNGRYFNIPYTSTIKSKKKKEEDDNIMKSLKLLWASKFLILRNIPEKNYYYENGEIKVCKTKKYSMLPLSSNHTSFFHMKKYVYNYQQHEDENSETKDYYHKLTGNDIISFVSFKNIINDKDDSIAKPIKMSISFKDSRKMCSFGFRYTFGCPENLYKTNFIELTRGQSVIFPNYFDYVIDPNRYKNIQIEYTHGLLCQMNEMTRNHDAINGDGSSSVNGVEVLDGTIKRINNNDNNKNMEL